jgi:branched-chain amino acid:cation transporter, LIVCS family
MSTFFNRTILSTGVAIFSMFFGAGNAVFPLLLGKTAGDKIPFALIGLLITAIGGPLLGMLGTVLFQGKSKLYFTRIGHYPGLFLMLITLCLLGPFAVMPRCITVAYAGMKPVLPEISLMAFSILFAIISLFCCINKNRVIPILGYVLSPLLLVCLILIIIKGKLTGSAYPGVDLSNKEALFAGLSSGYDTMDLIASLFFSATIWNMLQTRNPDQPLFKTAMLSGCVGGILLAVIYVGLCHVSAIHQEKLIHAPPEELITTLASFTLGPVLGLTANLAIALACLTTVIGLATTIADVLAKEFFNGREALLLLLLLGITAALSTLGFEKIMHVIHPMVALFYPAIIVLTLCNICYKIYGFESVKVPVALTLLLTIVYYWQSS